MADDRIEASVEAPVEAVVLDVGNVLLDWDPRHLYRKIFTTPDGAPDEERVSWFLENICTQNWNVQQDLGRAIADANATLTRRHPDWRAEIEAYYGRYEEMIPRAIDPTVACMRALQANGVLVHGLTNFGRETFAWTRERFDFLRAFDGVVVSGEEGVIKPDPAIFRTAIARFKLDPERTLFVDDSARNIAAAAKLGFQVHHFTDPAALAPDLIGRGLITQAQAAG